MPADDFSSLTDTQRQCLRLVARGHRSKDIARELGLSPHTVDTYLRRAITLLQANDRFEAARMLEAAETASDPAPSQRLRYQAPPIASDPDHGMHEASAGAEADRPGTGQEVREEVSIFGTISADRSASGSWLGRRRMGGAGNDLGIGERLIWMAAALVVFVVAIFLLFAAADSLQRALLTFFR